LAGLPLAIFPILILCAFFSSFYSLQALSSSPIAPEISPSPSDQTLEGGGGAVDRAKNPKISFLTS
jgi:hypothetical protein